MCEKPPLTRGKEDKRKALAYGLFVAPPKRLQNSQRCWRRIGDQRGKLRKSESQASLDECPRLAATFDGDKACIGTRGQNYVVVNAW